VTVADLIPWAQLLAGALWAAFAVYAIPAKLRVLRRRGSVEDVFEAVIGSFGWTQAGFTLRWWIWPQAVKTMAGDEVSCWLGLYILSAIQAGAMLALAVAYKRVRA
jgi:hypothetical protein